MDRSIYSLVFLLFLIGETAILSVNTVPYLWESPQNFKLYQRPLFQFLSFFLGYLVASFVIPKIGYRTLKTKAFSYGLMITSTLLLTMVLIKKYATGKSVDRWLVGYSIQPMEFTKLSVILFLSYYIFSKGDLKNYKYIFWSALLVIVNVFLIFLQPDRGAAIFILVLAGSIFFVGGLPFRIIIPISAVFILVGTYILFGQKTYVQDRLSAWQDPFKDPEYTGYQIIQSLYALADGGIFGKGIGKGIQKMGYLPQADTDFIVATIGEEMGFVGLVFIFGLYTMLIAKLFYWSIKSNDLFSKLVLFGIGMNFALAFLWNVAMATNVLPPKGIALPFVSYGFSNLFMSMVMIGVAQEVIKHDKVSSFGSGWYSPGMGRR